MIGTPFQDDDFKHAVDSAVGRQQSALSERLRICGSGRRDAETGRFEALAFGQKPGYGPGTPEPYFTGGPLAIQSMFRNNDAIRYGLQQRRHVGQRVSLYSDDAIITYVKNRPTPKSEVVASVKKQDLSTWKFNIDDVKIVASKIEAQQAEIKTILKMNTGGSVKDHPETYYFSKSSGNWLIVKETNP